MQSPVVVVLAKRADAEEGSLAVELARAMRALAEELPVLVLGLSGGAVADRLSLRPLGEAAPGLESAWAAGTLNQSMRLGQYGIHYVARGGAPSAGRGSGIRASARGELGALLRRSGWRGVTLVEVELRPGWELENALLAASRVILPLRETHALGEFESVLAQMDRLGVPRESARLLVSLPERPGVAANRVDLLAHLRHEMDRRGLRRYRSFLSSPPLPPPGAVAGTARGRAARALESRAGRLRQMGLLAREVFRDLGIEPDDVRASPASAPVHREEPGSSLASPVARRRWKRVLLGGSDSR